MWNVPGKKSEHQRTEMVLEAEDGAEGLEVTCFRNKYGVTCAASALGVTYAASDDSSVVWLEEIEGQPGTMVREAWEEHFRLLDKRLRAA